MRFDILRYVYCDWIPTFPDYLVLLNDQRWQFSMFPLPLWQFTPPGLELKWPVFILTASYIAFALTAQKTCMSKIILLRARAVCSLHSNGLCLESQYLATSCVCRGNTQERLLITAYLAFVAKLWVYMHVCMYVCKGWAINRPPHCDLQWSIVLPL
jgi:hypothetical protein